MVKMKEINEMEEKKFYMNGEWLAARSGNSYEVHNPATGELVSEVAYGDGRDARLAIASAANAFEAWSSRTAAERSTFLYKLYSVMLEEKESLAKAITLEMGKPLKEARGEVNTAAEYVLWYAEEAKRVYGEIVSASSDSKRIRVIKQPVGPVAAITPWNFPVSMVTRKIAPALAAGCTVVLKPSSHTPNSAIKLFECIEKAGFPEGEIGRASCRERVMIGEGGIV